MAQHHQRQSHGNFHRGGQNRERDQGRSSFSVPREDLVKILDGIDPQKLVQVAEEIARDQLLGGREKVTTSQIRNIYGTVKMLEGKGPSDDVLFKLILLKPKLAYAAGRHDKIPGMQVLRKVLSDCIDLVYEKKERFKNFCNFFEAILAYHKAEGGK